jgi:anti-sigma factor RsiW
MKHLNEDELVLHYYGERADRGVQQHLEACDACRANLESLTRVLDAMTALAVPEPSNDYDSRVWRRITPQLEKSRTHWWAGIGRWFEPRRMAAAFAMTALLVGAFLAGRVSERKQMAGLSAPVRERIMLVAVGEHLERSQMILIELVNNETK